MSSVSDARRVLVACVPQTGHVAPLLPLASALRAAGAEVTVATGEDVADQVTAAGLAFHGLGTGLGDWFGTLAARTRGRPGEGLPPERVEQYFVPRLFGEVGLAAMLDPLAEAAEAIRPQVIVFDGYCCAAPLVAARLGVPSVHHTVGPVPDQEVVQLLNDAVTPAWVHAGLPVPTAAGLHRGTTVTVCPAALDPGAATVPRRQPLRPAALPAPGPRPPMLPDSGRPLVYLTLGTFSNGNPELFRLLLRALAELDIDVLATVGHDVDPVRLGPIPANAVVERFVPQARVLPHCAAVLHHGGAGTTFGVLAHGLPAVVLPQSADNFRIARLLCAADAAEVLAPEEVTVSVVADRVRRVLSSTTARTAARRLAAEIAGMPSPQEVAARLLAG
jgi:UDP:flavonoid glycosyltransferase YjiC (YdhE family)